MTLSFTPEDLEIKRSPLYLSYENFMYALNSKESKCHCSIAQ